MLSIWHCHILLTCRLIFLSLHIHYADHVGKAEGIARNGVDSTPMSTPSYLVYLLVTSVFLPHLHSRNLSPELTSLTAPSAALHPLSGTHWTLTLNSSLLSIFKSKLKTHYFRQTFRPSNWNARLWLSHSASEVSLTNWHYIN